jgi:DNA-binding response OmpR family regulator
VETVLVVEDDRDLRQMFRTVLALDGFNVIEAADGIAALHFVDTCRPDLVILDLGLPIVDGYTVQQELAAQTHLRDIPIVIVTGQLDPMPPANVACLLRKPVTPDRLVMVVRQCLGMGGAAAR